MVAPLLFKVQVQVFRLVAPVKHDTETLGQFRGNGKAVDGHIVELYFKAYFRGDKAFF
jgi:hypothetical protein